LPFLIRRQTERITLMFGAWSSIANSFVATFALDVQLTLLASVLIAKHSLKYSADSCLSITASDHHESAASRVTPLKSWRV